MIILNPNKLKAVNNKIESVYRESSFYKVKYSEVDLVNYNSIPYLTQEEIALKLSNHRSNKKVFFTSMSSGTSNMPKVLERTKSDFYKSTLNQVKLMKFCNVSKTDVVGIAQPFGMCGYGNLVLFACAIIGAKAVPIGIQNVEQLALYLSFHEVTILDISPSKLYELIRYIKDSNIDLNIKTVMVAGETLPDSLIKSVREILGADTYNQYGTEELDGLSGAVTPGKKMKLLTDDYLFELNNEIELDNNKIQGELVVTSLYHEATPIIKYNTGDLCIWHKNTDDIEIIGRNLDSYNIFDSIKIYSFQVERIFQNMKYDIEFWYATRVKEYSKTVIFIHIHCKYKDSYSDKSIIKNLSDLNPEISYLVENNILEFRVLYLDNMDEINRKTKKFVME